MLDPLKFPRTQDMVYQLNPFPRQVRLETSSFCNSACNFCHKHGDFAPVEPPRKKGKMSLDLYRWCIEDIAAWEEPLPELVPTNFGELFIHRDWEEMLHLAAEKLPQTRLTLVTTGTLLNPERLEALARVPTLGYVNFSLNAWFPETYQRVMHLHPRFLELAKANVHRLRDRRPDVEVNVSMVYDSDRITPLETQLFETYWSQFGPVSINPVSYAGHPGHTPAEPHTLSCRSVFDGLAVFDTGDVAHGCCYNGENLESLRVGHVPEDRLLDVWRGDRLQRFAELHNTGRRAEIDICRRCTFA